MPDKLHSKSKMWDVYSQCVSKLTGGRVIVSGLCSKMKSCVFSDIMMCIPTKVKTEDKTVRTSNLEQAVHHTEVQCVP
jgi:hypothetical protein